MSQQTEVAYARCPQKVIGCSSKMEEMLISRQILKFYESHLKSVCVHIVVETDGLPRRMIADIPQVEDGGQVVQGLRAIIPVFPGYHEAIQRQVFIRQCIPS